MASQSLLHDVSWVTTQQILELFAPLLREGERAEAFSAVYERVKAGLECLEIQVNRQERRLRPTAN